MKTYFIYVFLLIFVFTSACSSVKASQNPADVPSPTRAVLPTDIQTQVAPTIVATSTSTLEPTQTATPKVDTGIQFQGYWIKITKIAGPTSWNMELMYQDGGSISVVATFCVHGSDTNTPDGVYFVVADRGTTYPHAPGYANTFFSHNYAFKIAKDSWYLHPAPRNDKGPNGCPIKSSGGCVNMRPNDFDILINGGNYTDPTTGQVVVIPHLGVGTPIVILGDPADGGTCDYFGQCMKVFNCKTGLACFKTFSCEYCIDATTRWSYILDDKPELRVLDQVQ